MAAPVDNIDFAANTGIIIEGDIDTHTNSSINIDVAGVLDPLGKLFNKIKFQWDSKVLWWKLKDAQR